MKFNDKFQLIKNRLRLHCIKRGKGCLALEGKYYQNHNIFLRNNINPFFSTHLFELFVYYRAINYYFTILFFNQKGMKLIEFFETTKMAILSKYK